VERPDEPSETEADPDGVVDTDRPARLARRVSFALVVLLLAGTALLYVRGTVATEAPLAPTRPADGVQVQLHQGAQGPQIQAAVVVAHPVADVWAVVTDYEAFGEVFEPPLWDLQLTEIDWSADRRECTLRGQAASRLLTVPVDVTVVHSLREDGVRIASWDDGGGERVNRGRWVLTPLARARLASSMRLRSRCLGSRSS